MMNEILIENGNKKVKLTDDRYGLNLFVMVNGFQWSGIMVDNEILEMVNKIIEKHKTAVKNTSQ